MTLKYDLTGLWMLLFAVLLTGCGGGEEESRASIEPATASGAACRAVAAEGLAVFSPLPPFKSRNGCAVASAVVLTFLGPQERMRVSPAATVNCPMTAALARWEREVVQPAARRFFGRKVRTIRQLASFACRTRNNVRGARLSEHGHANALDVAAFELDDGVAITVKDYWGSGGNEARFLRIVHDGSCKVFRTVLGPDANAAHADHFHLDLGRWGACE
jgi:hypothetical protein